MAEAVMVEGGRGDQIGIIGEDDHLRWIYLVVPLFVLLGGLRFWRRHYWGHSLVEHVQEHLGGPNPLLRLPTLLEALAVGFLLVALLGPVYPFRVNRIERGGLQILFVLDLSQSMEEGLQRGRLPQPPPPPPSGGSQPDSGVTSGSKLAAVKASATEFVRKRPLTEQLPHSSGDPPNAARGYAAASYDEFVTASAGKQEFRRFIVEGPPAQPRGPRGRTMPRRRARSVERSPAVRLARPCIPTR